MALSKYPTVESKTITLTDFDFYELEELGRDNRKIRDIISLVLEIHDEVENLRDCNGLVQVQAKIFEKALQDDDSTIEDIREAYQEFKNQCLDG